jgi:hypothetical protein
MDEEHVLHDSLLLRMVTYETNGERRNRQRPLKRARLSPRWTIAVSRSSSGWLRGAVRQGRLTMGKLIYSAITWLDGYVADEDGTFDWAAPD